LCAATRNPTVAGARAVYACNTDDRHVVSAAYQRTGVIDRLGALSCQSVRRDPFSVKM
jgi:hypothetical protein